MESKPRDHNDLPNELDAIIRVLVHHHDRDVQYDTAHDEGLEEGCCHEIEDPPHFDVLFVHQQRRVPSTPSFHELRRIVRVHLLFLRMRKFRRIVGKIRLL